MFPRSRRLVSPVWAWVFALLGLVILPEGVLSQPALSSLQQGTAQIASGRTSVTVPISPVDLNNCFLNFSYRSNDTTGRTDYVEVRGKFDSSSQLLFDRGGAGPVAIDITWEVICFSSGVSVQSGEASFASGEGFKDVTITPIALGRAFAIVSAKATSTGKTTNAQAFFRAELISSTTLKLTREHTGSAATASWFVVELSDGVNVEAGTIAAIEGSTAIVSINPIDPSRSFLIFSVSATSGTNGEPDNLQVRGQITTSTQLIFERGGGGGRFSIAWYVISFTSGMSVQRGREPLAAGESLRDVALSPEVDPNRCFVLRSTRVSLNAADADDAVGLLSAELTSPTRLRLQRDRTERAADVAWQVICFEAIPLTVNIANPTASSSQWARQGASFNVDFTTSEGGSYTIKVNDTVCGMGSAAVGANTKPCALPEVFAEGIKDLTVEVVGSSGDSASDTEAGAVRVDNSPPDDPSDVISTSHSLNVPSRDNTIDMSWMPSTTDKPISPAGVASGVDGYSVAFTASATPFCDRIKDLEEPANSFTSAALADGTYFFHICAVDNVGNWTGTVTVGPFIIDTRINVRDVVINEVAWMGTRADANDEWIELYNTTDQEIDLTGWTLMAEDGTPNITLSGTISAEGFFLLERTDDRTVSDIKADQIYTGALSNDGERLSLKDPTGRVIDTANGDGGKWPAGTAAGGSPPYATMERIDPTEPDADANWGTNDGLIRNGLDAAKNPINGTPKARNSCTNRPPIADAGLDQELEVGEIVQLDGSGSSDPDGDPLSYAWAFISKPVASAAALADPNIVNPTFVADLPGNYVLELIVADGRGGSASDQVTITARGNEVPTAEFISFPEVPTTCVEVQFADGSEDPDGTIISWDWAFGDGATSREQNPEHRYTSPGAYTVTLEAADDAGARATASKEIEVWLEAGDVDNDCQRTVKDAVLAARFALELLTPTRYEREAADVVQPCRKIDARDVVRLAEVALGIKNESIFICSGSSGLGLGKAGAPRRAARLTIPSTVIPSGGRASIKISSEVTLAGLQVGPEGGLSFDPRVIQIRAIRGIPPFQVLAYKIDNEAGQARFMAISLDEPRSGEVLELEVEAVGREGASSSISLTSDIALDPAGELQLRAGEARLTVSKAMPLKVARILSLPNPARGEGVRFNIEGQGIQEIQVRVYDLSGREIFSSGWVSGGTFEWNLTNSRGQASANGVYLYIVAIRGFGRDELIESGPKRLVVLR